MAQRPSFKQRRMKRDAERRAATQPRIGDDGLPVNQAKPAPPPAKDPPTIYTPSAPSIVVKHGAHPPPHVLTGADMMGDDRACSINEATGKVKLFRRLETWNVHRDDVTSRYIKVLLLEIARLRDKCGEQVFEK